MPVIIEWFPETNLPPEARNVVVRPVARVPYPSDLILSYDYYDPDGDPEQGSLIFWFGNGDHILSLNGLLRASFTFTCVGDFWYAMVRPRDNKGLWGDWAISNITWVTAPPVWGYRCPGVYPKAVQ
jgi:hypothetical protein